MKRIFISTGHGLNHCIIDGKIVWSEDGITLRTFHYDISDNLIEFHCFTLSRDYWSNRGLKEDDWTNHESLHEDTDPMTDERIQFLKKNAERDAMRIPSAVFNVQTNKEWLEMVESAIVYQENK